MEKRVCKKIKSIAKKIKKLESHLHAEFDGQLIQNEGPLVRYKALESTRELRMLVLKLNLEIKQALHIHLVVLSIVK